VNLSTEHIPVLAETLTGQINLPTDAVMVDSTIGHGGHSFLFGKSLGSEAVLIGLDVDENCLREAK
jgi:16S rRNA C1402 N4-methylase RsmH